MTSTPRRGKVSKAHQVITATERRIAYLEKSITKTRITLEAFEIEAESLKRILKLYNRKELENEKH